MNHAAILALISDLYQQVANLTDENARLQAQLDEQAQTNGRTPAPAEVKT